jgi:chromosome partitioning protein
MSDKAKVIAIYSLKGGVGKTSLAVNLAAEAAAQSKRPVLLWDLDPQAAASYILGRDDEAMTGKKARAASVFEKDLSPDKLILKTGIAGLDLLPADVSLRSLDQMLFSIGKKKRLAKLIDGLAQHYDRIILDCPPGLTQTSQQVMRAADMVLVPVIPSPLSRRALTEVIGYLEREHKDPVQLLPLFSMIDGRRSLHRSAMAGEPKWPRIPYASAIEQMAIHRAPVASFAKRSVAAEAFAMLWRVIDRRLVSGKRPEKS